MSIKYALRCADGHTFEGWFESIQGFDDQKTKGYLSCPVCNHPDVNKAIMAPSVQTSERRASEPLAPVEAEYVGSRFARELIDIHEGEAEARNIVGQASEYEMADLQERGIAGIQVLQKVVKH